MPPDPPHVYEVVDALDPRGQRDDDRKRRLKDLLAQRRAVLEEGHSFASGYDGIVAGLDRLIELQARELAADSNGCVHVAHTIVVCDPDTEACEAFAIVEPMPVGISEVAVREWQVSLVSTWPDGYPVIGQTVAGYGYVVSIDGSPIMATTDAHKVYGTAIQEKRRIEEEKRRRILQEEYQARLQMESERRRIEEEARRRRVLEEEHQKRLRMEAEKLREHPRAEEVRAPAQNGPSYSGGTGCVLVLLVISLLLALTAWFSAASPLSSYRRPLHPLPALPPVGGEETV